ncbi:hypothetical protein BH23BAC1_BH23BAC1_18340 [soil metagenome]
MIHFPKISYFFSLVIIFQFISFSSIFGQGVTIGGRVIDAETGKSLEFANVAVLDPNDSSVVTGAITEDRGSFEFKVDEGTYILRVGFIGYQEHYAELNIEGIEDRNLGNIRIAEDGRTLEGVTVEGVASMFETDIDKRVFNVENSVLAEGGTASELLATLPSIQVDEEGGINMRGSGDILIYINGRPSNLSGDDTESILAQFPANAIQSVELITNPSSRYDATGVGGIINIILKKDERLGLNGQINASVGTRHKYTAGTTLNYSTGKVNFFANYNFQYRELFDLSEGLRELKKPGQSSPFLDQSFNSHNENLSNMLRAGFDYDINERNNLGFYIQGNQRNREGIRYMTQIHQNAFRQQDSLYSRTQESSRSSYNIESGITYNLEFDTLGQELFGSVSYAHDNRDQIEHFDQLFYNSENIEIPQNRLLQIFGRPRTSDLFIFQLDYTKPFRNGGKMEGGLKSTLSREDRSQVFEDFNQELNQYILNDTISDRFVFDEHVHAAYLIYRNRIGKLGYQGGLRAEQTFTNGYQGNTDTDFVNNYFNLFPSLYLTYTFQEDNELLVNYSRRIRRPRTWFLAPFINPQDL